MRTEYIQAAMNEATYEIIDDAWPYYGEIKRLKGLWASGRTLEECRRNLAEALEGWLIVSLQLGNKIPTVNGVKIRAMSKSAVRRSGHMATNG